MTLVSNHHFPRHSHDQFGVGVIASGAQRSWSGIGLVSASAGDVIMANPGEMHDGLPLDSKPRQRCMIYIDPALLAREVEEETVAPVEIVHPVARDPLLAGRFARLFACLTTPQSGRLAREENLLRCLMHILRRHVVVRLSSRGPLALRCESDPAPELCSGDICVSGRVGRTVGREPVPTLARLRTRSRNNTACLPYATARASRSAAPGERSNTCPSSYTGPASRTRVT
jgi:AraC-like ligand binding domain